MTEETKTAVKNATDWLERGGGRVIPEGWCLSCEGKHNDHKGRCAVPIIEGLLKALSHEPSDWRYRITWGPL
jgi:hypothetical protein